MIIRGEYDVLDFRNERGQGSGIARESYVLT